MKKAFTMIELIFVIVIIGILAAVAVPRLFATRIDAKVSKELGSAKQSIYNLGMEYTAKNKLDSAKIDSANNELDCFLITDEIGDGNVSLAVAAKSQERCPDNVLNLVTVIAKQNGLITSDGSKQIFNFSRSSIVK